MLIKTIRELVKEHCLFYKNGTCSAALMCEFGEGGSMECAHFLNHVFPKLCKGQSEKDERQHTFDLIDLKERDVVIFDCETTGLDPYRDRIVEIGMIKYGPRRVEKGNLWLLLKSDVPLSPKTREITGLTQEMIDEGSSIEKSLNAIMGFIGHEDTVLVAHNLAFDISFLNETLKRFKRPVSSNPTVDSFALAAYLYPFTNCHLIPLAKQLGIDINVFAVEEKFSHLNGSNARSHRALFDAHLAAKVFFKLEKEYFKKQSESVSEQNNLPLTEAK